MIRASMNNPPVVENGLDVVLALLYAPGATQIAGEPVEGITRLQKLLFLLWKEGKFYTSVPDLYGFNAYDFGPCMDDLYDDLDFAQSIGLISMRESYSGNEYEDADEESFLSDFGFKAPQSRMRRDFALTERGMRAAGDIFQGLSEPEQNVLRAIKSRFNRMPFFDLLRYVYQRYPQFAKKSILSL